MVSETVTGLPILQTARLTLHVAGPGDAERCATFNRENAEFLAPWEPAVPSNGADVETLRGIRKRAVDDANAGVAFSFAIFASPPKSDTPIIGWLGLTNVVRGVFQACVLGYKLDRRLQGQGYMTEAAQAGIDFAFDTLQLHRVMAAYMPHNQRSAALLRRLGFTIEGVARDYLYIAGDWRDHVLTSLVNPHATPPAVAQMQSEL